MQRFRAGPAPWGRWLVRAVALLGVSGLAVGCPCMRDAVNDSPSVRWWLFSTFGAERLCPELLKRSAPLALAPGQNVIGRFYPSFCRSAVDDTTRTLRLEFGGTGYAALPVAGRVGFAVEAAVEYAPDFYLGEDDSIYVFGRFKQVLAGPSFHVATVQNKVGDWAVKSPAGLLVNTFAAQIVQGQLTSGFTVVRTDNGDRFTLGVLTPPQKPHTPFDTDDGDRFVFANETTELQYDQVDFLGPFEVAEDDQALFLRFRLNGPPMEALVLQRGVADGWRDGLQRGAPLGPPPGPVITGFALQPGVETRQRVPLGPGQYFVVLDHSTAVGLVKPPWSLFTVAGAGKAVVSYTAELGERDADF